MTADKPAYLLGNYLPKGMATNISFLASAAFFILHTPLVAARHMARLKSGERLHADKEVLFEGKCRK